jgi:tetratricopeptide (TPR) repeat protein
MTAAWRGAKGLTVVLGMLVLVLAIAGAYVLFRGNRPLSTDPRTYEEEVRSFYRALASLQVGLLDDAKTGFAHATELVPGEPASWANLSLSQIRLGDFDGAFQSVQRARALAPASSAIEFLSGQLEKSRGRPDEAIGHFRRAVELDPNGLRPRAALAEEIERAGGPDADARAQQLFEALLGLRPENLAILAERARLAARRSDSRVLHDSVDRLAKFQDRWSALAVEQFRALKQASDAGSFADAARATLFLRNSLLPVPAFRQSLAEIRVPSELIAEPFVRFVRLPSPSAAPSAPDEALTFSREPFGAERSTPWAALLAFSPNGTDDPVAIAADGQEIRRIGAAAATATFPGGAALAAPTGTGLLALDWNRDYRMDLALAGRGGLRLLVQRDDGTFEDVSAAAAGSAPPISADTSGVWTADIEMDGDLDLVVGVNGAAPVVLRNNGDGTWRAIQPFTGVVGLKAFAWGDLDGDGDPDAALLDEQGVLHLFENRQGGTFEPMPVPAGSVPVIALSIGDVNADGVLDLVTLDARGSISRLSRPASSAGSASPATGQWERQQLATWPDLPAASSPGAYRIFLADLDNNGALDLVASGTGRSRVWLAGNQGAFQPLATTPDAEIFGVVDLNGDGQLDLVGLSNGQPVRLLGRGTKGYHWQLVRPRAQPTAGDQRINSFGVGGEIEVRSGLLTQKQILTGGPVHFGLGARTGIDVTRIVWPNGIIQADFDRRADEAVVAEQRLKGSCPWVFTYDGKGMRFVTDFLWRSPLGLRINAQDTAGVTQTEDWVKVRGDQLVARNGLYDVRITAELWETHFVDHVSLMVADHPADVDVFVDERFARQAPVLSTHAMRPPRHVARAWDEKGRDVTDVISRQDGRYLATFELGTYQGIARDHFVEFELGADIPRDKPLWLVANGWIYPTDSSINVAIAQAGIQPRGLSLEAQDQAGRWTVVEPDLGFPAGKNKTILIDLSRVTGKGVTRVPRLRLRTNLEVYWDWLAVAERVDESSIETVRLQPDRADLGYRGFSETDHANRFAPEVPIYDRIANVTGRWRDLVGYYTRFGDVRELLDRVDDRYVIMNAGDELRLQFPAPPPPAEGWTRDFVLVGDGWVKDGDYNTSFSKTVEPLPAHDRPNYESSSATAALEQDPVYRRHLQDWRNYHTRFVAPDAFLRGLRFD